MLCPYTDTHASVIAPSNVDYMHIHRIRPLYCIGRRCFYRMSLLKQSPQNGSSPYYVRLGLNDLNSVKQSLYLETDSC